MSALIDMGGYGAFVWPSYALALAALAGLAWSSWRARARARAALDAAERGETR
jgi:heme exporter protein CcmD